LRSTATLWPKQGRFFVTPQRDHGRVAIAADDRSVVWMLLIERGLDAGSDVTLFWHTEDAIVTSASYSTEFDGLMWPRGDGLIWPRLGG